ncbi:MAG: transcription antitermination factor NusB [Deferribacteraceae bacterium]|jgi:N utilization substance protein B|nr:transcription antitermination factor NusB [Deferribacteraceae bacterium]
MKKRTISREYAVQMVYQACMTENSAAEVESTFWKSFDKPADEVYTFAGELFRNALKNREEHDRIVTQFLTESWTFERLGEMEKCVLRVAIDELLNGDTPAYAIMNDYVAITNKFTDKKTASFVNGILEKIRNTFGK